MKNKIHLKIRDLVRRGGNRSYGKLTVKSPMVSATSPADAVGGNIAKQARMDDELVQMNKKLSGGAVTVPQIGAAGGAGNETIKSQIASTLQGGEDGALDGDVLSPDDVANMKSKIGGRRRRKTKRRRKKKKRKTRRKRKSRRKSKRKRRKSKKRRRR